MTLRQYNSIRSARKCWERFSSEHAFQSYAVMRAIEKSHWRSWYFSAVKRPLRLIQHDVSYVVYEVCADDGTPMLLAPFQIIRKDRVLQAFNTTDYQDFLYGPKSNEERCLEAWRFLVAHLKRDGFSSFEIKLLPDESRTKRLFDRLQFNMNELDSSVGTSVDLGSGTHDEYFSALGKHAKQNVRTAYNRLQRDGHSIRLAYFDRQGIGESLDSECGKSALESSEFLYFKRQNTHYGTHEVVATPSLWNRICMKVFNPTTLTFSSPDAMLSILYIDDRVAAFMYGFYRQDQSAIELPRLAIESDFNWYSPGLVLINETAKLFMSQQGPRIIDLCQGDEKYKLDMGGKTYVTRHLKVEF